MLAWGCPVHPQACGDEPQRAQGLLFVPRRVEYMHFVSDGRRHEADPSRGVWDYSHKGTESRENEFRSMGDQRETIESLKG
jgi:hypothetical protein